MQIFVSRPTWIAPQFEEGLNIFLMSLENLGLKPRTLGVSDYPSKAPLDEVIEIMRQCEGAIILGYPQLLINEGFIKTDQIENEIALATEWNHIETALAYSQGLPILVAHHKNVSRGIFDRGVMNAFVHSLDLSVACWSLDKAFNGALKKWQEDCESGNSNFSAVSINKDLPLCPNCSTTSKPVYMSELPLDFQDFGKRHCTICDYMEQ
jgi:hypothetical protein